MLASRLLTFYDVRTALSDKDNDRRPGRYLLLQEEEKRVFGADSVKCSLTKGYKFKELLGDRRWQDVMPNSAMHRPQRSADTPWQRRPS